MSGRAAAERALSARIHRELAPVVGRPGPRRRSARPVERGAIWNFCEAVQDGNPVYWDEGAAATSRFGRLVAPPQSLMALNMPGWWTPPRDGGDDAPGPQAEARAVLARFGFVTLTFVERDEEYLAPFGPGDGHFLVEETVTAVSDVKGTKVGRGVFLTIGFTYFVEATAGPIARARTVTLVYDGTSPR